MTLVNELRLLIAQLNRQIRDVKDVYPHLANLIAFERDRLRRELWRLQDANDNENGGLAVGS